MGQEIVHCSVCGIRLRSVDFGGGAARLDGSAYCRDCARELNIPPDPPRPPDARSSEKSTGRIPVVASSAGGGSSRNSTRRIAIVHSTSTARIPIPTPRRGIEAVPSSGPTGLIWGSVGLGAVLLLLAVAVLGRGTPKPEEPGPVAPVPRAAVPAAPRA